MVGWQGDRWDWAFARSYAALTRIDPPLGELNLQGVDETLPINLLEVQATHFLLIVSVLTSDGAAFQCSHVSCDAPSRNACNFYLQNLVLLRWFHVRFGKLEAQPNA